ncbi:MAG: transketolase C-terminal domain-containing protein, partial [Bacteroidia bacterium]
THAPACLILSRQNIKSLPGDRKATAKAAEQGAYIVQKADNPDVVLVANGSEVATLIEGAALLKDQKNLNVQVVSAPSEGVFREQSKAYQEAVIPSGVPVFGMTAGLPVALEGLAGPHGKVFGLSHFGYSAPYTTLDEKFGFTAENVVAQVGEMLNA